MAEGSTAIQKLFPLGSLQKISYFPDCDGQNSITFFYIEICPVNYDGIFHVMIFPDEQQRADKGSGGSFGILLFLILEMKAKPVFFTAVRCCISVHGCKQEKI